MNFLPTNLELLGRFLQCSGHSLSRTASSKTLGKPGVWEYIYIYRNICFFCVNMALHLLKCVRSESAGGAAYQAGSVSENNPPRENQQRFIGEK